MKIAIKLTKEEKDILVKAQALIERITDITECYDGWVLSDGVDVIEAILDNSEEE